MNNILFLGKIVEKSKIRFDFYNKLKASSELKIYDIDSKQIFSIIILEKYCDYINLNLDVDDIVLLICVAKNINGEIKYILKDIE